MSTLKQKAIAAAIAAPLAFGATSAFAKCAWTSYDANENIIEEYTQKPEKIRANSASQFWRSCMRGAKSETWTNPSLQAGTRTVVIEGWWDRSTNRPAEFRATIDHANGVTDLGRQP